MVSVLPFFIALISFSSAENIYKSKIGANCWSHLNKFAGQNEVDKKSAPTFKNLLLSISPRPENNSNQNLKSAKNCTSDCCQDLLNLRDDPTNLEQLLKFYDASATYRSPSRFAGYLKSEGTYSLCKRSGGNYCRIKQDRNGYKYFNYHCIPKSCSVDSINQVVNNFGENMPINLFGNYQNNTYDFCYDIEYYFSVSSLTWWEIFLWLSLLIWAVFITFSPIKSIKLGVVLAKITDQTVNPHQLNSLQGLRVMALFWVIAGHVFVFQGVIAGGKNFDFLTNQYAQQHPISSILLGNGSLSVDAFFVISGFLSGYILAKKFGQQTKKSVENTKTSQNFNWLAVIVTILKRLVRFIPPIGAAIFLTVAFLSKPNSQTKTNRGYIAWDGPDETTGLGTGLFGSQWLVTGCQKTWYYTLFLIYFMRLEEESPCLGHLWYLSTDFWIGFIVLFAVYFYFKSCQYDLTSRPDFKNLGFWIGSGLLIFTLLFNLIRGFLLQDEFGDTIQFLRHDKYESNITEGYWSENYNNPWYRLGPYLISCYFGVLLVRYENASSSQIDLKESFSQTLRWKILLGFIATIGTIYYNIINLYYLFYPKWVAIILTALWRYVFGLSFAYLIYQLEKAKQGWIYQIFSHPKWYFLSRINFSTYICHWFPLVLVMERMVREFPFWTETYLWAFSVNMIVRSYVFGLIFFILFENPLDILFDTGLNQIITLLFK